MLSMLVGAFHALLYVLIRGRIGLRFVLILAAAMLGAFAGSALGERLGDPIRLGDYPLLWASIVSWVGILMVAIASLVAPATEPVERTGRVDR